MANIRDLIKVEIEEKGWMGWLRANLFTGLLVAAPAVLTWWLIVTLVFWVDGALKSVLPEFLHLKIADIPGLGLLGGAVLLVCVGMLVRNYVGQRIVDWADDLFERIPLVRSVYSATKKLMEAVGGKGKAFREVVLVPFPREGSWAIGLLTGLTEGEIQTKTKNKVLNVFVPTTPNPSSGFLLFVPERDVIRLDMSVDEVLKMVMSGGIVKPTLEKKVKKNKR